MSKTNRGSNSGDPETDQIMEGLAGDEYRLGQRYYVFAITYHYIGTLVRLTDNCLVLDNAIIVLSAGDSDNAVSQIVQGKSDPKVFERPGKPIIINRSAIVSAIPF